MNFHEQMWQHEMVADAAGEVPVALVNDAVGLGFEVVTRKAQFPCQYQWQKLQSGHYAMSIEHLTNHVLDKPFASERGARIWRDHGDEPCYATETERAYVQERVFP